jgi:hypothetical protein
MSLTTTARSSLLALALIASLPALAHANDGTWGGSGSDLVPLKEKRIRMAAEDIVMEYVPVKKYGVRWQVTATYTFENPTDEAITVSMGFPETFCDGESDCGSPDNKHTFWDMKTTVDGKPVKMKVGAVSAKEEKWAPELGRVHLFDVKFAPKAKVSVVHTYHHGYSGSSMGDSSLYYITKTGSLWNGPIGKARFTVRMPERPWGLVYPKTYNLQSYTSRKQDKKVMTEIIFEQQNWTPTQDLDLYFGSPMTSGSSKFATSCPDVHESSVGEGIKKPTLKAGEETFGGLSDEELRICRNLPFAHHGYTFKDEKLQKLFYGPGALKVSGAYDNEEEPKDFVRINFQPNPFYDESMLSKDEQGYVKLIKLVEEARKKAKK